MDRLPTGEDECELGSLDMDTGVFSPVALTRSWNFQQGAMLQWNPVNPDEIIYNVYTDHGYRAVVKNIHSKKERMLQRPLANVSADGKWGLSINMNRVYDFRAGYGYCNEVDAWKDQNAPEEMCIRDRPCPIFFPGLHRKSVCVICQVQMYT